MKILFITPCIPTQSDGRRVFNFIRALADAHEIHLISLKYSVQTMEQIQALRNLGVSVQWMEYSKRRSVLNCFPGMLRGLPLRVSWCCYPALQVLIQKAVDEMELDVIHIDRMRMGQFIPRTSVPILLDFTDSLMLYLNRSIRFRKSWLERFVDGWERRTITAFERRILKRVQCPLVCSYVDADCFRADHPGFNFHVIRNVVDTEQFAPKSHALPHSPRLILTGTLFYFPNVDSIQFYVEEILPRLRFRFPSVETLIIGTRPIAAVRRLDGKDGIRICEDVPRMEDHLFSDDIYICPLRVAAGIRNKLLEAMSVGMPVVTTPLGAEGMDVEDGKQVLMAESVDEFVDKVERVLQRKIAVEQLSENARQYVQTHHSLRQLKTAIESCYASLIERR